MNIWINREFGDCSKLSPQIKEAFIRLATCYEMLVRATFRSSSIVSVLDRLPQDSRVEVYIVAAMDARDWLLKREKLSKSQFKSLDDKVGQLLGSKTDPDVTFLLREIRKVHSSFNIGVILSGEMGRAESQMSEFDRLLVEQQTRMVLARTKAKQT